MEHWCIVALKNRSVAGRAFATGQYRHTAEIVHLAWEGCAAIVHLAWHVLLWLGIASDMQGDICFVWRRI